MKWRKNKLFKTAVLFLVIIFSWQCSSITTGGLVSSEEKIDQQIIRGYQYGIEKIKEPSSQDPTLEYKVVKFPVNRGQVINTYEKVKIKHSKPMLWCFLLGAGIGFSVSIGKDYEPEGFSKAFKVTLQTLGFGLYGLIIGRFLKGKAFYAFGGETVTVPDERIIHKHVFFEPNKIYSTPVPNFPVKVTWRSEGKQGAFEIATDDQGIIRIHVTDDLKMSAAALKGGVDLTIGYLENQKQRTYRDRLEIHE